uniref:IF rod domain-containing protein n=1 Tax=Esox lucius TaxID=8010 RepID=A0AAY5KMV5_ESOLU
RKSCSSSETGFTSSVGSCSRMSVSGGGGHRSGMYGGSGVSGVHISRASNSSSVGVQAGGSFSLTEAVCVDENKKTAMQTLNSRLASYLDKVGALEMTNTDLEMKIIQFQEEKDTPKAHNSAGFKAVINTVQEQICDSTRMNGGLYLAIDNAKLAADDFKVRYESELAMRQCVDADIAGLRRVRDELTIVGCNLEMTVEALKEDLVHFKKDHKKDLKARRDQVGNQTVEVEVDAAPQGDLVNVMARIRADYEGVAAKNRLELEGWFKDKSEEIQKAVAGSTEDLQSSGSEVTEVKRKEQSLEIELQAELSLKASLTGTLADTQNHYTNRLSSYQMQVTSKEGHLGQIRSDLEHQGQEYRILLDIKTRLEMEIGEYRRLLDGEASRQARFLSSVDGRVISQTEAKSCSP